jgi:hypothetical protein
MTRFMEAMDEPPHRRVAAQPVGAVHTHPVAGQPMAFFAGAWVGEYIGLTRIGQTDGVIRFAIGQQSVGGDNRKAAKLQQ